MNLPWEDIWMPDSEGSGHRKDEINKIKSIHNKTGF